MGASLPLLLHLILCLIIGKSNLELFLVIKSLLFRFGTELGGVQQRHHHKVWKLIPDCVLREAAQAEGTGTTGRGSKRVCLYLQATLCAQPYVPPDWIAITVTLRWALTGPGQPFSH